MKRHLKRLGAPKFWHVKRKETTWVVKPRAGPHKVFDSIPLLVLVKDVLKITDTGSEARKIIKSREVLVDCRARRDHKYPVGLMDVVSIPRLDKHYRIVPGKKGLEVVEITKAEAGRKMCRINDKTVLKGGIVQLNCHDGRNIRVGEKGGSGKAKDEYSKARDEYKTGDSLLIELPSQKILEHVKLEKGSAVLVTKGKNAGSLGNVKELSAATMKERAKASCAIGDGYADVDTAFVFVVGKTKPLLKVV